MEKMIIVCPKCGANIDLTQAVEEDFIRTLKEDAKKETQQSYLTEMADLRQELDSKNDQLSESRKIELKLRKQQRELMKR
jgi:hypothetical protein